jgi:hypothetical protein
MVPPDNAIRERALCQARNVVTNHGADGFGSERLLPNARRSNDHGASAAPQQFN